MPRVGFPAVSAKAGIVGGTVGCQDSAWWAGVRKAHADPEGHVMTGAGLLSLLVSLLAVPCCSRGACWCFMPWDLSPPSVSSVSGNRPKCRLGFSALRAAGGGPSRGAPALQGLWTFPESQWLPRTAPRWRDLGLGGLCFNIWRMGLGAPTVLQRRLAGPRQGHSAWGEPGSHGAGARS